MYADHMNPVAADQLTGVAVTFANDRMVTTDTQGRIKMFNISRINWDDPNETTEQRLDLINNPWFVNAHRKMINTVEIVE